MRTPQHDHPRLHALLLTLLAFLALIPLTGCDHLRLALGMRTSLAKVPVTAMEPSLPNGAAIAPGEKSPLVVTFTDSTGKTWVTEGKGAGRIQWRDITVTPSVVTVNKKGILTLAHDPRISQGKVGHVSIQIPSHPTLKPAELDIPLTYAYPFQAAYAGASGFNGTDGTNGSNGISGSPGSMDPNNPSPGGDGTDGGNGGNGTDGGDGSDGPSIQVWVTLLANSSAHPLLQAKVSAAGHKDRFYLIDPQGGSLTLKSDGGSGGRGGAAGKGGSGGSGGIGTPSGSNGNNGSDGTAGSDGRDGSNGPVTVTYDPSVQPYLSAIVVSKRDVSSSTFTQAPVPALW